MGAKGRGKKAAPVEQLPTVVAYKGFDANWQCRGFQYAVGGTYTHEGSVEACAAGFHSCENPLDVLSYYGFVSDSGKPNRFAIVEAGGEIARHDQDTKLASAQITIKAEIRVPEIVTAVVKWVTSLCKPADSNHATGYRSASSATGDRSASSATGDQSASLNTGWYGRSEITTADPSKNLGAVAIATGYRGTVRAPLGSAIVACYRDAEGNLLHIRAGIVGQSAIKPDTFYRLNASGEFEEVT